MYAISNADLGIYLDAVKILKENAYPKVSYDIKPNGFAVDIIKTDYNMLSRIININDYELHFKNVRGYISSVELDLD